jgi:hypothetical protein
LHPEIIATLKRNKEHSISNKEILETKISIESKDNQGW